MPKRMATKITVYLDPAVAAELRVRVLESGSSTGAIVEAALVSMFNRRRRSPTLSKGPGEARRFADELVGTQAEIAAELNRRGFRTATGRRYNAVSVSRLLSTR